MNPHRATLVFVLVALALLALMAAQVRRESGATVLGEAAGTVSNPVVGGIVNGWRGFAGIWSGYIDLIGAGRERDALLERLAALEAENAVRDEVERENRRLRELLQMKESGALDRMVVGRVIADLSDGATRHAVIVDRGKRHAIAPGWVVLQRGAVAGRVVTSLFDRCEVLLILDPDAGVSIRHQESRYSGILSGGIRGASRLARLEYVPRDATIAVGDVLVTAGIDGIYPPGLHVGRVSFVEGTNPLTWTVRVEVDLDPAALEEVVLIPPYVGESFAPVALPPPVEAPQP